MLDIMDIVKAHLKIEDGKDKIQVFGEMLPLLSASLLADIVSRERTPRAMVRSLIKRREDALLEDGFALEEKEARKIEEKGYGHLLRPVTSDREALVVPGLPPSQREATILLVIPRGDRITILTYKETAIIDRKMLDKSKQRYKQRLKSILEDAYKSLLEGFGVEAGKPRILEEDKVGLADNHVIAGYLQARVKRPEGWYTVSRMIHGLIYDLYSGIQDPSRHRITLESEAPIILGIHGLASHLDKNKQMKTILNALEAVVHRLSQTIKMDGVKEPDKVTGLVVDSIGREIDKEYIISKSLVDASKKLQNDSDSMREILRSYAIHYLDDILGKEARRIEGHVVYNDSGNGWVIFRGLILPYSEEELEEKITRELSRIVEEYNRDPRRFWREVRHARASLEDIEDIAGSTGIPYMVVTSDKDVEQFPDPSLREFVKTEFKSGTIGLALHYRDDKDRIRHKVLIHGRKGSAKSIGVVIHEFAHMIDRLHGEETGKPASSIFWDSKTRRRAIEALARFGYETDKEHVENPVELFAELTELYVLYPRRFRKWFPDLYEKMKEALAKSNPDYFKAISKWRSHRIEDVGEAVRRLAKSKSPLLKDGIPPFIERILMKTPRQLTRYEKELLARWALMELGRRLLVDASRRAKRKARYVYTWIRDPSRRDIPGVDTPEALDLVRTHFGRLRKVGYIR